MSHFLEWLGLKCVDYTLFRVKVMLNFWNRRRSRKQLSDPKLTSSTRINQLNPWVTLRVAMPSGKCSCHLDSWLLSGFNLTQMWKLSTRQLKYFSVLSVSFCSLLLLSNLATFNLSIYSFIFQNYQMWKCRVCWHWCNTRWIMVVCVDSKQSWNT